MDFQLLEKKDDGFDLCEKKILNEANWQFHLFPTRMNEHHKDVKQKLTIKKKKSFKSFKCIYIVH